MAGPREYDVVVIGAGIVGSATAYHLAKSGQKTLLLGQVSAKQMVRKKCQYREKRYCHDRYPAISR